MRPACIFALGAVWYARPLLRSMSRADALTALLEPLPAEPTGVLALVLSFFVPLVLVSLPLLTWQLTARRDAPLTNIAAGLH
jgi:hypothetical protein